MKNQDPVLEVLEKLAEDTPSALLPLIEAYRKNGMDAIDDAWKKIIKDVINENK